MVRGGVCGIATAFVCGCFSSPPVVGDPASSSEGSSEASGDTTTGTLTGSTTDATTSTGDAVTSAADETSGLVTTESETDESSSTGGPPPCGCVGDEVLCESFEPPFDPHAPPWAIIRDGGAVDPTLVSDPVHCGDVALRSAVQPGDLFSVANAAIGAEILGPGPNRIASQVWIEASCSDAPTRLLQLQIPNASGIWYQFELWAFGGNLEVRMNNHASQGVAMDADVPLGTAEWHEVALEIDMTTMPPGASVIFDGAVVIEDVLGPPLSMMATLRDQQRITLGVYRNGGAFPGGCVVVYDDVRVTAM